ncbi:MAG: hypothetical protein U0798_07165 [Gemmataceae bacterium]
MFSSVNVSRIINGLFEPVWVNVREVPIVTIDFGNGSKIARTLNGNVATYVLSNDGSVLDILPGIYKADAYVEQLDQLAKLHHYLVFQTPINRQVPNAEKFKAYHETQALMIKEGKPPQKIVMNFAAAVSKARIENPLKLAVVDVAVATKKANATAQTRPQKTAAAPNESAVSQELQSWKELADDTELNETMNRKLIHEFLAKSGPVPTKDVTKWLYKNVLHADLDDPTLGLGELLNKNYPFAEEDRSLSSR